MMLLCDQDNASAKVSWTLFAKKYVCMQPKKELLNRLETNEHAYAYTTANGQKTVALSISPGLEYLCQNKGGPKANANKEKFLGLINSFKQQNSASSVKTVLGKRPGYSELNAPVGPEQPAELPLVQLQAIQQMTKNQLQIKSGIDIIQSGQMQIHDKVTGVGNEMVSFKGEMLKEVASLRDEVKQGNDRIKYLEKQLREKDQKLLDAEVTRVQENQKNHTLLSEEREVNKRQRYQISQLHKQLNGHVILPDKVKKIGEDTAKILSKVDAIQKDSKKIDTLIKVLCVENDRRKEEHTEIKTMLTTMMSMIAP